MDLKQKKDELPTQLGLFTLVDLPTALEPMRYSNAIGGIDVVPRFLRGQNPFILLKDAPKITEIRNPYMVNGIQLVCKIKPAQLTKKIDGELTTVLAYPSDKEELIEKVLFMLASNGDLVKREIAGVAPRHGIAFSLYDIRQQLKLIGKDKPYDQIRESLLILRDSSTIIAQESGDREIEVTNKIFADSILETNGNGRGKDKCFVTFSDYVIEQILDLNFRQYSFSSVNSHKIAVAVFIHSYLTWNWLNVSAGATFDLDPATIMEGFGKGRISIDTQKRDIRRGLMDLTNSGHIVEVPRLAQGQFYPIVATQLLVDEIIRANTKKKGLAVLLEKVESGEIESLPNKRSFQLSKSDSAPMH